MRLLIIITRNEDEFAPYWKSLAGPYIKYEHSILVLNGKDFENIDYSEDGFGALIRDKINHFNKLTNVQEVGIISHGGGEDNPNIVILQTLYNIRFNRKYSSLLESLCVRGFNAVLYQGILPLDRMRDIVCDKPDVNDEYRNQSFNSLWNYFSGDPLLEARIHLWKLLTLLGVKIKRGQVNAQKYAEEIETIKSNEKIKNQPGVISILMNFETIEVFHKKMDAPDFFKQLFPN